ncbi:probably inactive leucine-rich repeat receptor-like protein kinase IMK2 [Amborella trichopoda]|uniref:Protein kinase domain-containing protein n=1 Tax=Amborella trichopoda TaxID=13333 RepID=W1NJA9_AMBTC|nr:probably inactive leucine-rich repeat receptor-like protein kinase IMK2 [Amborella trichopoda]ERM95551.1 hypothetical protein AMTR_s00023p00058100 [Amborella trichopoda]|eukprot:XP_006828135.1 probably inactive leucine-rich repeat receptor-like protein kinase IMK2 [Amborella trichopoda]
MLRQKKSETKRKKREKQLILRNLPLLLQLPLVLIAVFPFQTAFSQSWDGIVVTQADYQALQAFKHALDDPKGVLRSWNDSGVGVCSGGWIGIKCVQGQVIAIQLPWKGLGGRISEQVGQLPALRKLSLHDNVIEGAFPSSLWLLPTLRGVYLFNNRLSGTIPPIVSLSPLLQTLDIRNNSFTGVIPKGFANSTRLYRLNLAYNRFVGSIPVDLTQSSSLTFLSLQNNSLSGPVPDTWGGGIRTSLDSEGSYQLQLLNLEHNSLSGPVPPSLSRLKKLEELYLGSNQINGSMPEELGELPRLRNLDLSSNSISGNLPLPLLNLSSLVQLNIGNNQISSTIPEAINKLEKLSVLVLKHNRINGSIPSSLSKISGLSQLDLSENNLTGRIPPSLADLPNLDSLNVSYNNLSGSVPPLLSLKFNSSSFKGNLQLCGYSPSVPCSAPPHPPFPPPSNPPNSHKKELTKREKILIIVGGVLLVFVLLLCCLLILCWVSRERKKTNGKGGNGAGAKGVAPPVGGGGGEEGGGEAGGKLVHFDGPLAFTADDLLCATAEVMGKSTYGTVYKATLEDGNQVAVKRLRERISKGQREFEAEAGTLGKIRHPNLLPLRAYYWGPKDEKLLVFDFMPGGSLAAFLHARGPETPIDWSTRMNIAISTARGLHHLHTRENIVHGNLTAGNILLDEDRNAKIADFGLSRLMTAAANSNVIATAGALGYRAPELSKLKKASTKTDIYSLGVVLLELLTGKAPSDASSTGASLPEWVASIVKEEWTNEVFDLELIRDSANTGDELLNTLKLALHCVDPSPSARPDIEHVLHQLEEIKPELAATQPEAGATTSTTEAAASAS